MKLSEIAKITKAVVLSDFEKDLDVKISTDTRTIEAGDFYLPLKGASFDGENFYLDNIYDIFIYFMKINNYSNICINIILALNLLSSIYLVIS